MSSRAASAAAEHDDVAHMRGPSSSHYGKLLRRVKRSRLAMVEDVSVITFALPAALNTLSCSWAAGRTKNLGAAGNRHWRQLNRIVCRRQFAAAVQSQKAVLSGVGFRLARSGSAFRQYPPLGRA